MGNQSTSDSVYSWRYRRSGDGLVGLQRSAVFFKTLLERVGIAIHAETRQEFKSVLQPFTATEFSKEQRDNLLATLTSLNGQVVNEIAESRAAKLARLQPGEIEATPASIVSHTLVVDAISDRFNAAWIQVL